MPIQLVEEITRRKRYKKIYFYTSTDRCGCYLAVDVYPKDLFNTEMCNEIERSFDFWNIAKTILLVYNVTRTVIKSIVKFPNSNIAIDFAETWCSRNMSKYTSLLSNLR
jgi:hypothetical protein